MRLNWAIMLALAAAFTAGVLYLFGVEFAAGDIYPEYSSLRTDQQGTRLLYDSLARLPGIAVARNYLPLSSMVENGATVLLFGSTPQSVAENPIEIQNLERIAKRGNRVVIALVLAPEPEANRSVLYRAWGIRIDWVTGRNGKLYFPEAKGWNVMRQTQGKPEIVQRAFGSGEVVLIAGSGYFTNESAVIGEPFFERAVSAIGSNRRVVFDESHLGIAESGSVIGLARRFRLTGVLIGLAICAALFVWRSAASFPPPLERPASSLAGRTSQSGLLTLLRKHVPAADLAQACWAEWLSTNRTKLPPDRIQQAARVAQQGRGAPIEAIRDLNAIVHAKGNS